MSVYDYSIGSRQWHSHIEAIALAHAAFRAGIERLGLESVGQDISMDTVAFRKNWLPEHIAKSDMAYLKR